ncbi:hypothetical protein B5J93_09850 [Moraxella equi]|nr:hypothetical protein B5J93_09850 [Moraxella equi]
MMGKCRPFVWIDERFLLNWHIAYLINFKPNILFGSGLKDMLQKKTVHGELVTMTVFRCPLINLGRTKNLILVYFFELLPLFNQN